MAFRVLLVVLLVAECSLTALAQVDDDFAEFDDEEGEFDFDMPGELVIHSRHRGGNFFLLNRLRCSLWIDYTEEEVATGSEESDQFDDGDDGEEMVSFNWPEVALIRNQLIILSIQTVEDDDEDVFEVDVEEFEVTRSL